jgi:hypothetical protein
MAEITDIGNTENSFSKGKTPNHRSQSGDEGTEEEIKDTPILKPKTKRKMSENQMKNLEVGRQRRKEKLEEKKENLKMEYAKKLYEEDLKNKPPKPDTYGQDNLKQSKSKPKPAPVEESSSEEEEVIIRSKQSTKKKKKKKVVIELSSSDDDIDEEEEEEAEPKPSRKMVSQQNKKSVIKVTEPVKKNYFAD